MELKHLILAAAGLCLALAGAYVMVWIGEEITRRWPPAPPTDEERQKAAELRAALDDYANR